MLFSKDIRKICALCANATDIDEETILCRKKGPMACTDTCRRFKYDPLRRKPSQPAPLKSFSAKDFQL